MIHHSVLHQVTVGRRALETALRRLVQEPQAVAWGPAGINRTPRLTELLCCELHIRPLVGLPLTAPTVVLTLGQQGATPQALERLLQGWWPAPQPPAAPVALLVLEQAPRRGNLTAVWHTPAGASTPVHTVKIVGPGMHKVVPSGGQATCPDPVLTPQERERWSRLIGALEEAPWQRLRALRYGLVGVGRTGSLVATSLARLGLRHLTLIDPDRVEIHNLDAMDGVTARDLGRLKVTCLRDAMVAISGGAEETRALPDSITALRALGAAKEADVLIACVDHDGARLATALLATLYAKPLLDIGTGIFGTGGERQMGADVRLILPGERCLWCLGGVANPEHVRQLATTPGSASSPRAAWQAERAGSLRSLNQIAAHLGLRLLEDLVAERVQHSTWLHLEFDRHGRPALQDVIPLVNPACPLCQYTAAGDAGLAAGRDLLQTWGAN